MEILVIVLHVLCSILLVTVILLQSGKGGGLGAGFGGASAAATQIFGGRGAGNFLSRTTVALAVIFMLTSFYLAWVSSSPRSVMDLSEESGAVGADEDEIVEVGSGPPVDVEDREVPEPEGTTPPPGGPGTDGSDTKLELDMPDALKPVEGDDGEAGAAETPDAAEEAPAVDDTAQEPPSEPAEEPAAPAEEEAEEPAKPAAPAGESTPPAEEPAAEEPTGEQPSDAPEERDEPPSDQENPPAEDG